MCRNRNSPPKPPNWLTIGSRPTLRSRASSRSSTNLKKRLPATWHTPSRNSMPNLIRFAFLAALTWTSLYGEALNDILARMDESARNFKTFSAKMKRTEFTKILNDTEVIDGARRLGRTNGQTVGIVELFGKN